MKIVITIPPKLFKHIITCGCFRKKKEEPVKILRQELIESELKSVEEQAARRASMLWLRGTSRLQAQVSLKNEIQF